MQIARFEDTICICFPTTIALIGIVVLVKRNRAKKGMNCVTVVTCRNILASSPGHSQILSRSRGEKSGEGLVPILCHGPEMVDSVST